MDQRSASSPDALATLAESQIAGELAHYFKGLGFRSGSLNEWIPLEVRMPIGPIQMEIPS